MFLKRDLGIPDRILCLNPKVRPQKLSLSFDLTLRMLQHCACYKLLVCLHTFSQKIQQMSEKQEHEQISETTAALVFASYLHQTGNTHSPAGVSLCSVQSGWCMPGTRCSSSLTPVLTRKNTTRKKEVPCLHKNKCLFLIK